MVYEEHRIKNMHVQDLASGKFTYITQVTFISDIVRSIVINKQQ